MQIQFNTDGNVHGDEALSAEVNRTIEGALSRFSGRITRVEVHLSDENGNKKARGSGDLRCLMEARLEGRQPIAVTHRAATSGQAIEGAADKLTRLIEGTLGRLRAQRGRSGNSVSPPAGTPRRTMSDSGSTDEMTSTGQIRELGQSLWLDSISRRLLTNGTLDRYISDLALTGLTSNPTIFENAIEKDDVYDDAIRAKARAGHSGEALFFEIALEDLIQAADSFRPIHDASNGADGWVSLEVSPLLADDSAGTVEAATRLHARAQRSNLFIKIPGTPAGLRAIEETIFSGVPVNVTLLLSREHYLAAAEAYMRGIERRIAAGRDPHVASVASIFVSRWDVAVAERIPAAMRNRLGIAIAMRTYKAYRDLLASPRWRKLAAAGARHQRLLWASTGTKDPAASDVLYVEALAAPDTINTLPEKTLLAFAEHGQVNGAMSLDGGDAEAVLDDFARQGVDTDALAADLQREGVVAFAKSWRDLLQLIGSKRGAVAKAGGAIMR